MDRFADDDLDPLAPVLYGAEPEEEVPAGDAGHSDPDRIVRVWVRAGRLERVQVSPVWQQKVREKTLDDCFAAALAGANIGIAEPLEEPEPDLTGVDFSGLPRFGRSPFATYRLAMANFHLRWEEAVARQQANPAAPSKPVEVEHDGVRVTLDDDGHVARVAFDEEELEDMGTREIAQTVLAAAARAQDKYERTPVADDELSALAREHEILMGGLMSMLTGRH